MHDLPSRYVTLVLGGVRSGKSRYAQQLAERSDRVTFVATAEARNDDEMRSKIQRHRNDRPAHWTTIEEPLDLGGALESASSHCDLILVDCLTLFAANLLEEEADHNSKLEARLGAFSAALSSVSCSVVIVSNEVGSGIVPEYPLGRRYRDLVGEINQRIAAQSDNVLLMIAGLPLVLKGSLQPGFTS
ncbi:bifunctional adenosylcobinamide kinase/adenosylcobinamide-phosphate guanylyltransferase [Granulicella arctica]|uniref:bifunctional adenosylcobinamide kinase/adenosylcobinamide-phosphate guanylyltransferase n=1 Tax=Granulicella arctica TaxID=940613 RepID=UPI0021E05027|nr:bifunctional adenosylcobinamide kinase/adenosylcobinamide-phosphate guanylyltransferase [Granulicella arctica]